MSSAATPGGQGGRRRLAVKRATQTRSGGNPTDGGDRERVSPRTVAQSIKARHIAARYEDAAQRRQEKPLERGHEILLRLDDGREVSGVIAERDAPTEGRLTIYARSRGPTAPPRIFRNVPRRRCRRPDAPLGQSEVWLSFQQEMCEESCSSKATTYRNRAENRDLRTNYNPETGQELQPATKRLRSQRRESDLAQGSWLENYQNSGLGRTTTSAMGNTAANKPPVKFPLAMFPGLSRKRKRVEMTPRSSKGVAGRGNAVVWSQTPAVTSHKSPTGVDSCMRSRQGHSNLIC